MTDLLEEHRGFSTQVAARICIYLLVLGVVSAYSQAALATEPVSDIRSYNHQGIQRLISMDVLRASMVTNGSAQLVVGSRYFTVNGLSQARLAMLADRYLRDRKLKFSTLEIVDGRTGRAIATYDPARGYRSR